MKEKERNLIGLIRGISQKVLTITEEEFSLLEDIAKGQLEYSHPLKCGTAIRLQQLGEHNMKMIKVLREFKDVLEHAPKAARVKVKQ